MPNYENMTLRIRAGAAYFEDSAAPGGWKLANDRDAVPTDKKVKAGDGSSIELMTGSVTVASVSKQATRPPTILTRHPLNGGDTATLTIKRPKPPTALPIVAKLKQKDRNNKGKRTWLSFKAIVDFNA